MNSAAKILKCAGSTDSVTLKAGDKSDTITFLFESKSTIGNFLNTYSRSGKSIGVRIETYGLGC